MDVGPADVVVDIPGGWQTDAEHARNGRLNNSLSAVTSTWVSARKRVTWLLKCVWYAACKAMRYIVVSLAMLVCLSIMFFPFLALVFVGRRYPHLSYALGYPSFVVAVVTAVCSLLCLRYSIRSIPLITLWGRRRWMLEASHKPKRSRKDRLAALPAIAMEKVVLQYAAPTEKKALRLTCRSLRNILDNSMTAAAMSSADMRAQHAYMWLWRMRHVSQMRGLTLPPELTGERARFEPKLEECVPQSLTSLVLKGPSAQLGWLHCLPSLANLRTESYWCQRDLKTGCSNLTRLEAPYMTLHVQLPTSLQHLESREPSSADLLSPLANLRVLVITKRTSPVGDLRRWKYIFCQLPLEHLTWPMAEERFGGQVDEPDVLKHLPRTLKSLTFSGNATPLSLAPASMPIGVTHLQLLDMCSEVAIQAFAGAAPGISHLDVSILKHDNMLPTDRARIISSIRDVGQFRLLQSLKLYIEARVYEQEAAVVYDANRINLEVPELVPLAAMGLAVEVCSHPTHLELFRHNWPAGPEWSMPCE